MTPHLAGLDGTATDEQLSNVIAAYLLSAENPAGPFKLGYDFNALTAPPPVKCDIQAQGHTICAIERTDKGVARAWIKDVLAKGLYVQRYVGSGWRTPVAGGSIKSARYTLEVRERKRLLWDQTTPQDDDEIPF